MLQIAVSIWASGNGKQIRAVLSLGPAIREGPIWGPSLFA